MPMDTTLHSIFQHHFAQYARTHTLPLKHHKAARAIMHCRTEAMGAHLQRCPDGHEQHIQYHSCKHRSCPRCNALPKAQWVHTQQHKLLHCDHYHVIFTLPHQLLALWQSNQRWFTQAFFQSCRDTLITLLADPKHLGALPGILMAMHTWGRTLSLHPHIHCLVTGGGWHTEEQWRGLRYDYLLPVAVVKALFKGKLLAQLWEAINNQTLKLPRGQTPGTIQRLLRQLADKDWNVCIRERYTHGQGVMLYLSRYVKGGAINNPRLIKHSAQEIQFRYQDHRDQRHKTLALRPHDFMQRILWHVPEKGQHMVRHYGLYAQQNRDKRNHCRLQLQQVPEPEHIAPLNWQQFLGKLGETQKPNCSTCGQGLVRCPLPWQYRWSKNSMDMWLRKIAQSAACSDDVQQGLQHNTAPRTELNRGPPLLH